jgi:hypothetical protein
MKKCFLPLVILLALSASVKLYGAPRELGRTNNETRVDGVVEPDEYSYAFKFKKAALYMNWRDETVYMAVTVRTKGWIALGYGSRVMNNSHIVIGYVGREEVVLREELGKGKGHGSADELHVRSYRMTEVSGITTLEIELDEGDVMEEGQKKLFFIVGYGSSDSLGQYHEGNRANSSVKLLW